MTRISTGASAQVRSAMIGADAPPEGRMGNAIELTQTKTTLISDVRRTVFMELRERGAGECVCRSAVKLQRSISRRARTRNAYNALSQSFETTSIGFISVIDNIEVGDYLEVYMPTKTQILSVKKCRLANVSTPYVLTDSALNDPTVESFLASPNYSVLTNLTRRESFARDVYAIATQSPDPMYRIAALRSMEQYFLALISAGKIDRALAEKKYSLFDKVQERIWRGATDAEKVAAFRRAWVILANITGLTAETAC